MASPARNIATRSRQACVCPRCSLPIVVEYSQFGSYRELTADAREFHYQQCAAAQKRKAATK